MTVFAIALIAAVVLLLLFGGGNGDRGNDWRNDGKMKHW